MKWLKLLKLEQNKVKSMNVVTYTAQIIQRELAKYYDKDPKEISEEQVLDAMNTNKVGNYTLVVNNRPKYVEVYLQDKNRKQYYELTFIRREIE